nr:carbon storage regulator [uncultured Eisenbergiella sp.]
MLVLRRKKEEAIRIGADITVTITDIGQDYVNLAIDAPREINILRSELAEAARANREAAQADPRSVKALTGMLQKQKEKQDK